MKRIILSIAMLFCVATAVFAETMAGKVVVGGNVGGGITYAQTSSPYKWEGGVDLIYGANVALGYGVNDSIVLFGGLEYAEKNFDIDRGSEWISYSYNVIDFLAGVRFIYLGEIGGFYGDLGFFYGTPLGDVKWEYPNNDYGPTSGTVPDANVNNDYGMIFGVGYLYLITEQTWLDFGLRMEEGFSNIIDYTYVNIKSRSLTLNIGVSRAI